MGLPIHSYTKDSYADYITNGSSVLLVPDAYQLEDNQSWSDPVVVRSGETQEWVLGVIRVLAPDREEAAVTFYEADTERRLGNYGGTVLLMPGSYTVEIADGPTVKDVVVEAGQVTVVK